MMTRRRLIELAGVAIVTAALVAPATAAALGQFADVPDSHVFASEIEWMADNGITEGCGNGLFCPGDPVTRGQMSAFMERLATLRVVDARSAQNSATLNHKTSFEIAPVVSAQEDPPMAVSETNQGLVEVNEVTITVPEDGLLIISGTAYVNPEGPVTEFILRTKVNGTVVGSPGWSALYTPATDLQTFELAYTVAEEVTEGTHTIAQEVGPRFGATDFIHNHETLTVVFVPAGQATFSVASTSESGTVLSSETGD